MVMSLLCIGEMPLSAIEVEQNGTDVSDESIEDSEPEVITIPAQKVTLNKKTAILGVGEKLQLKATVKPANTTDTLTWKSNNTTVATVTKNGRVTAKAAGTAKITAEATSGKTVQVTITVKKAPSSVKLNVSKQTLNIKDTKQLKATLSSKSTGAVTWTSSKPSIVSVTKEGKLKALKAGKAVITVKTYNGKKATCTITVRPNAKKITLNKTTLKILKNKTSTLKVTYSPSNSKETLKWSSSNTKVAKVSSSGKITAVGMGTCYITAKTKNSEVKAKCKVTVYVKQIALTFDDGPQRKTTTKLLDGLKKKDVLATFFLIGQQVPGCADLVKRMKKEGHEIGNHSYTHAKLTNVTSAQIQNEINKTRTAIKKACGSYPTLFRSPYGSYNNQVLKIAGVPHIFWSVDSLDWKTRNVNAVKKAILEGAEDGAIILLHDIHATTVEGALAAIDELKKQGYEFVTVSQLLKRGGKKIESGKTYYKG